VPGGKSGYLEGTLDIARARFCNQLLGGQKAGHPRGGCLVGRGAGPDFAAAKWALGVRLARTTDAAVEKAFDEGEILRAHPCVPLAFPGAPGHPRPAGAHRAPAEAAKRAGYRRLELTTSSSPAAQGDHRRAARGRRLTRAELRVRLAEKGIQTSGRGSPTF